MRNLLLVLHIVGVATWLGADLVQLAFSGRLTAEGGRHAATWMNTTAVSFARVLYMPAGALILISGIAMVLTSDAYEFSNAFVGIGLGVVIIGVIMGVAIFGRRGEKAARAFESGDDTEGHTITGGLIPYAYLDAALVIFAIVAMVGRWGA